MKSLNPIPIVGVPASPYTRKMLAVLRYRRIPYAIEWGNPRDFVRKHEVAEPKPILLPIMIFEDGGERKAVTDSTPIIRHLEDEFPLRGVIPNCQRLAFLNYVLEDFADEWVTKHMFHYRWHFEADKEKASTVIPLQHAIDLAEDQHQIAKQNFADLQTSRLWVVGSNENTAPIIEASYTRLLKILDRCLSLSPYLFGNRPSSADFSLYGQLTQLIGFDSTSSTIAHEVSPRLVAWLDIVEDLSGENVTDSDWMSYSEASENLAPLFEELGRGYVPALLANAKAVEGGESTWATQIDGAMWEQRSFPYQAKCLRWINEEFQRLEFKDREQVESFLTESLCSPLCK